MKSRSLVVALVATVGLLAAAAVSQAGPSNVYEGSLDGAEGATARVGVTTYKRNDVRYRRYRFAFDPIAVTCDGDGQQRIARRKISGGETLPAKSDKGRFGMTAARLAPGEGVDYVAKVRGRLVADEAKGFVRMRGDNVELEGGETAACDSGKLRFTAALVPPGQQTP